MERLIDSENLGNHHNAWSPVRGCIAVRQLLCLLDEGGDDLLISPFRQPFEILNRGGLTKGTGGGW